MNVVVSNNNDIDEGKLGTTVPTKDLSFVAQVQYLLLIAL